MEENTKWASQVESAQELCLPCLGRGRIKVAGGLRPCPMCTGTGRRSR